MSWKDASEMRIYFFCIQPIQWNFNCKGFKSRSKRKDYFPVYIFLLTAPLASNIITITFWKPKKCFFSSLWRGEKNTKRKETHQCHYCDTFFRYRYKYTKHIKHCSGRPGFIYCFQDAEIESYENYIKQKGFSFTVVGHLETTTGYISELEGGSMFATSYCIIFNFHPLLEIAPVVCSKSFGQNGKAKICYYSGRLFSVHWYCWL